MGEDKSAEGNLSAQVLLGGVGVLLLAAGMWGYFGGPNDKIAGGFFVLVGLVLVVLAAFYKHVDGIVELGLLKVPILRARRAEKQVELGRLVAGNNLDEARNALEESLVQYHHARVGARTVAQVPASSSGNVNRDRHPGRSVLLVEDAVFTMVTLTPHEQDLVRAEVARMSRPEFPTYLDLRATRPGDAGRSYRMHRVPECDIRLWYRQKSVSEPYTLYVVVIEDFGEDH